jgi:hypothetical protein
LAIQWEYTTAYTSRKEKLATDVNICAPPSEMYGMSKRNAAIEDTRYFHCQ